MSYLIINSMLVKKSLDFSAAEAHGFAVGLLCVDSKFCGQRWLSEFTQTPVLQPDEEEQLLIGFFEKTRRLLADEQYEFTLFLPDDNSTLAEQAEALIVWCRGFLLGLGIAHSDTRWSRQAREIIMDIIEFTRLDSQVSGEEDERAFMEVSEYVRTAVFLLREELQTNSATLAFKTKL